MQEVSVQIGELFARADLLQVVRGNDEEVTKGVECVEELQHQWDLEDRQKHTNNKEADNTIIKITEVNNPTGIELKNTNIKMHLQTFT